MLVGFQLGGVRGYAFSEGLFSKIEWNAGVFHDENVKT